MERVLFFSSKNKKIKSAFKHIFFYEKCLKSAFRVLVKKIQIEILHWKIVKNDKFDFLKVKILLNFMQTYYFCLP